VCSIVCKRNAVTERLCSGNVISIHESFIGTAEAGPCLPALMGSANHLTVSHLMSRQEGCHLQHHHTKSQRRAWTQQPQHASRKHINKHIQECAKLRHLRRQGECVRGIASARQSTVGMITSFSVAVHCCRGCADCVVCCFFVCVFMGHCAETMLAQQCCAKAQSKQPRARQT
jgi:hypothetical protein